MANRVVVDLITTSSLNADAIKTELGVRATACGMSKSKVALATTQSTPTGGWHVYGQLEFPNFFRAHDFYDSVQAMWVSLPFAGLVSAMSKVILNDRPGIQEPDNKAIK